MQQRSTSGTRWLLLGIICLLAAGLAAESSRRWVADRWYRSADPELWARAAELEPGNADYWHRLGQFRQWDLEQTDLRLAVEHYRRALVLAPGFTLIWMDLASAYEALGEIEKAREAFQMARASHPKSGEVAWRWGNFLLRQGDLGGAFAQIRRAVEANPLLTALAVSSCWQAGGDVARLFEEALPPVQTSYLEALKYFRSRGELSAARASWEKLLALGQPFDAVLALPLVDDLLRARQWSDAATVWQQITRIENASGAKSPPGEKIWDGGFERDLVNGGLAWHSQPPAGVRVGFDTQTRHGGRRSLRIDFNGTVNVSFAHVYQNVLVEPNTRYRLSAYLQTEGVTTDRGVRLWVVEPDRSGGLDLGSEQWIGTNPWTPVELEFTTLPATRLLRVMVRRDPSRKLDNRIRGTVWLDDVTLRPVNNPSARLEVGL